MNDPFNICEYCLLGFGCHDHDDDDPDIQMLVHAVTEIDSDLNFFVDCPMIIHIVSRQSVSLNKPLQALGGGIQRLRLQLFYIQNDNNNDFIGLL